MNLIPIFMAIILFSFVECGLITDLFSSVAKEANKIHENLHNTLITDYHNQSDTEHPSRGIIGNVFDSIGKEIKKVSEIRESLQQDIYDTLHKKIERQENSSQKPVFVTVSETQDLNRNNVSEIVVSPSKDEKNLASNNAKNLTNTTEISTEANKTNAENKQDEFENIPLPIDVRHFPPKSITLKPMAIKGETESKYKKDDDKIMIFNETSTNETLELNETITSIIDEEPEPMTDNPKPFTSELEITTTSINKDNSKTQNVTKTDVYNSGVPVFTTPAAYVKNSSVDENGVAISTDSINTPDVAKAYNKASAEEKLIDSINTPDVAKTYNKASAEEKLSTNDTTYPLIDVRLLRNKTNHTNDDKLKSLEGVLIYPDVARKFKNIVKDNEKTKENKMNVLQTLPGIVFRDSDNPPTTPCPSGLKMEQGSCVPDRNSFKGDCPPGTQRGDGDICEEIV